MDITKVYLYTRCCQAPFEPAIQDPRRDVMQQRRTLPRPGETPASAATIYETIRTDIVRMRLRPGERLSENGLGIRFRTSRTPVREAIVRLVDDGLIEVWPQRG